MLSFIMSCLKIILFASYFTFVSTTCDYNNCPKINENSINIHLVPHTHDDVGWLKTADQYYYGVKNSIQDAGVQYILDSVVLELMQDSSKRFIYVETAFFWQWWQEQTECMKQSVKKLVNNGQLEFIGGGWSMNDEAAAHYQSIIDQFTWGFKRLNDTFGKCGRPKIGWQIDPFGHSRENAAIMARMGFDGLFLGRIDWQDKLERLSSQTMEMIWKTSQNDESEDTTLFTGVLYNTYSAPKGFCFDINCHDEPIVDNIKSPEYNANVKVARFLDFMRQYSHAYKTKNILVTMGEDFMYMDAHVYFKNMDKLIKYINKIEGPESKYRAFYSTPSCYLKSVHDAQINLPVKKDDFFPYSSDPNSFWTGYYTSRPTSKRLERLGNNFLQICKQMYSLSKFGYEMRNNLISLREAMGVMQHHDAITGTEKQHVAADYARMLTKAIHNCENITQKAFKKLTNNNADMNIKTCLNLNISSCDVTENENMYVVTIYNPLSRAINHLVKLPIKDQHLSYSVKCPMGKEILTQTVPLMDSILSMPGRKGQALAQLVFIAKNIPPLGFKSFYVSKTEKNTSFKSQRFHINKNPITIGFDDGVKLHFTAKGDLQSIEDKNHDDFPISQTFYYYNGWFGNNHYYESRSSGAYIFRPNSTHIPVSRKKTSVVFKGPLFVEVQEFYSDWVSQVIRIYNGSNHIEFNWVVGPIPINDYVGKEIVTEYHTTQIHNNGEFYTDSNGRESIKRILNYRETWPLHLSEPIAGNYYPVTTKISIEDNEKRMSIITDRSQGGSSLRDGTIELMVHRRLLHDDAFGVGEALNETAFGEGLVAVGSHFLTLDNNAHARILAQEKVLDSWLFFTPTQMTFEEWQFKYKMEYSGLSSALPDNVQILTLEPWSRGSFLLRLEHIIEKNDDPDLSRQSTINLKDLFENFEITNIEEMTLGANIKSKDIKRLRWNSNLRYNTRQYADDGFNVVLKPMQIRTFIIKMEAIKNFL